MKLTKSVYQDDAGNIWELSQQSLPKKKGTYLFWIGECKSINVELKEDRKYLLIKKIKERLTKTTK